MDQRILEFIGDLRRAELRISPSEAMDALSASSEIGLEHRDTFKSALAATLVKESRDLPTFDRIFDLYFLDLEALGAGLERLMYFLQIGYFSRRIYDKFDWEAIERDLSRIMQLLESKGLDPGMIARIRNYLDLRLEAFRRMIRQHVERELERRAYRQGEKLTREVLTDKPLFASARRRRAASTRAGPSARACSTAGCPWRSASAVGTGRSRSWSPSATCRTRCATPRASCCSWCGACRSASRACAPTSSSPRSRRSPRPSPPTRWTPRSTGRSSPRRSTTTAAPTSATRSAGSCAPTSTRSTARPPC